MKSFDLLPIGQLAARTGLSVSAIRFYEVKGLVSALRNKGGQRRFLRADIRRLSFIRIAQQLGFTIVEIQKQLSTLPQDLWNGPARNTEVMARVRRIRPIGADAMVLDLDVDVKGFAPSPPGAATHADGTLKAHLKHVVEKRDGDWKIVASQNTFVAPLPSS